MCDSGRAGEGGGWGGLNKLSSFLISVLGVHFARARNWARRFVRRMFIVAVRANQRLLLREFRRCVRPSGGHDWFGAWHNGLHQGSTIWHLSNQRTTSSVRSKCHVQHTGEEELRKTFFLVIRVPCHSEFVRKTNTCHSVSCPKIWHSFISFQFTKPFSAPLFKKSEQENEQLLSKKRPFLNVYSRWLDALAISRSASFGQDNKTNYASTGFQYTSFFFFFPSVSMCENRSKRRSHSRSIVQPTLYCVTSEEKPWGKNIKYSLNRCKVYNFDFVPCFKVEISDHIFFAIF